jgi:hypothetical protein
LRGELIAKYALPEDLAASTALSFAADALEQYWKERDSSQFDPEVSTHTILQ